MAEIIILDVVTKLDIPAERVLTQAGAHELDEVVVVGWDKDGDFYFASSHADGAGVLWLLEMAKKKLLETGAGER